VLPLMFIFIAFIFGLYHLLSVALVLSHREDVTLISLSCILDLCCVLDY
jgi:hypothetical protein